MKTNYDYLIVGAGLYGAVAAHELNKRGYKVLVVEKRNNIAGNIYTEEIEGIQVHKYGPHIFHTSKKEIWDYVNQFAKFNDFINMPLAFYKGKYYNMPFNMNTFRLKRLISRNQKTLRKKPSPWWAQPSMKCSSKAIPKSNGADHAMNFHLSSSHVYQ